MFEKTVTSGFEEDSPNSTKISYQFTQTESLLFADDVPFTIQCNVYTSGGTRHASYEMSSRSGVQYLRDVLIPAPMQIILQPTDCEVTNIGNIAEFHVTAQGVMKYQWQYCVNNGAWKDASNGTDATYRIEATQERVSTHKYRCLVYDFSSIATATNVVRILYTDRSDE